MMNPNVCIALRSRFGTLSAASEREAAKPVTAAAAAYSGLGHSDGGGGGLGWEEDGEVLAEVQLTPPCCSRRRDLRPVSPSG